MVPRNDGDRWRDRLYYPVSDLGFVGEVNAMKKRISVFLTVILLCLACAFPVWAETESRLADQAGLLDTDQKESLCNTLDEISERDQVDVVVVTVNSLEGKTAQAYAEDYFIDHGYGQGENGDGILFLLDMGDRNWAIATHGYAIEVFTDAGQSYIMDQVKPYLSDGDYNEAFHKFATECDDFITQANEAEPYDVENLPDEPFAVGINLLIALAVGLVAGLLVTGNMRRKLKTVRKQDRAASYVRQGSMNVTRSNDFYLYSTVSKSAKPKNEDSNGGSSTHTSSSGDTFGGSSGKF